MIRDRCLVVSMKQEDYDNLNPDIKSKFNFRIVVEGDLQ